MKNYNLRYQIKLLLAVTLMLCNVMPGRTQVQSGYVLLTGEAADRLAIKDLIDAYGHDADRREAEKQAALFTMDGVLENIHTEPGKQKETTTLRGRKELTAGFAMLKKFEVTMHVNGQSTIELHGDS